MKSGRRNRDRHRNRLTENARSHFARSNSGENAVIKFQSFPPGDVLPQRDLIERATFVIIEDAFRQLASRYPRIIGYVQKRLLVHARSNSQSGEHGGVLSYGRGEMRMRRLEILHSLFEFL